MKTKKLFIVIAIVLIIAMAFTNPSEKSFEHFVNGDTINNFHSERTRNFVLFSSFRCNNGITEKTYLGVFNCFILTKTELQFL